MSFGFNMELALSDLAYKTPEERQQWVEEQGLENDYFIDQNDDEFFSLIGKHENANAYNVHRGTSSLEDLGTDVQLALNRLNTTDRYKRSLEKSKRTHTFHRPKVIEIGHSLGGTLAEQIGQELNHESVAFNMGTTPLRSYKNVNRKRHRHIRREGDIISSFDDSDTAEVLPKKRHLLQSVTSIFATQNAPLSATLAVVDAKLQHSLF